MKFLPIQKQDIMRFVKILEKESVLGDLNIEMLLEKVLDDNVSFFKLEDKKKVLGFVELQEIEEGIVLIEPFSTETKLKKKNSEVLLSNAISELKIQKVNQVILHVKNKDSDVKKLCKKFGFNYSGSLETEDGGLIEEFELELDSGMMNYIS